MPIQNSLWHCILYINFISSICDPVYDPRKNTYNAHNELELFETELS